MRSLSSARRCPWTGAPAPNRFDATIEAAAYFVVCEGLTNVARYAQAESVDVDLEPTGGKLAVTISDDGIGGADSRSGSGLPGLVDRVQAVGGRLEPRARRARARGSAQSCRPARRERSTAQ